jgi:hypothetical protein
MKAYNSGGFNNFQLQLPNSTAVLILGILSVVSCWCYGIFGLILGSIALVLAAKDRRRYLLEPDVYTESSYKNLVAGRIVAIVGVCISGLFLAIIIIALLSEVVDEFPWEGLT